MYCIPTERSVLKIYLIYFRSVNMSGDESVSRQLYIETLSISETELRASLFPSVLTSLFLVIVFPSLSLSLYSLTPSLFLSLLLFFVLSLFPYSLQTELRASLFPSLLTSLFPPSL